MRKRLIRCMDNAMNTEKRKIPSYASILRQLLRVSVRCIDDGGEPLEGLDHLYRVVQDIGTPLRVELVDLNLCLRFEVQVLRDGILRELRGELMFDEETGVKPRLEMLGYNKVWKSGDGYTLWSSERGEEIPIEESWPLVQPLFTDEEVLLEVRMYLDYLLREAQVGVLRHWIFQEGEKLEDILLKWSGVMSRLRGRESCGGALYRANEVGCEVILEEGVGSPENPPCVL